MALTKATLIDLNSNELVLDLDADTSITADTDDTIHFKIAGADELVMTGTALTPAVADGSALGSTTLEWSDLFLADGAVINFGADQDVTLTHVADSGLALKSVATADDKPVTLVLQTGETDIAANDVLGVLNFQAPDEATGTDAILVAAGIAAVSEGDFSASANATKLSFRTAVSAAASETMSLTSNGDLFLSGGLIDLKNDGNAVSQIKFYCESSNAHAQTLIGAPHSEGATNTLTLPGTGGNARLVSTTSTATLTNKTLTTPVIAEIDSGSTITLDATTDIILDADGGDIIFKDGGTSIATFTNSSTDLIIETATSDKDLIFKVNDGGSSTEVMRLDGDVSALLFPSNKEIRFTDANESIKGDGSNLILKSGGTAFTLPASDGSSGQALTTNGSGVLSFSSVASNTPSSADGQALGSASLEWSDLFLADGGQILFGNDQDVTLTHNADKGLILKHTATADDKPVILTLQTGETDMAANDVIGKIEFQAPNEGTGTDAVLVSGAIQAIAEGDHSSSSNATSLQFMTGASEAATAKMTINSAGKVGIGTTTMTRTLNITDTTGGASTGIQLIGANDGTQFINFGDTDDSNIGEINYDHSTNKMLFRANDAYEMSIFNGVVGTGADAANADLGVGLHIKTADSGASVAGAVDELVIENSSHAGISILTGTSSTGAINFGDSGDNDIGNLEYNHSDNSLRITTGGSERFRLITAGNLTFAKTSDDFGTAGITLYGESGAAKGSLQATASGAAPLALNRLSNDGTMLDFYQDGGYEGNVSVSGSTVSYNTFCGSHWTRLADNSKPTILRGTVMESIATMCDWYQAVAQVAESTDSDGNVIPAHDVKESINLPDGKSVGDAVTFTSQGKEYTGVYAKEDNEQLPKCKISDTAESKAVYGVFMRWDDADDGLDGDVNDMTVASLGAFVVRIHKDETVAIGDYLQSKGDGTAKKQSDDILRSSTIAKVTSTTKTHTHSDGSYCVPCTLHCG